MAGKQIPNKFQIFTLWNSTFFMNSYTYAFQRALFCLILLPHYSTGQVFNDQNRFKVPFSFKSQVWNFEFRSRPAQAFAPRVVIYLIFVV